MKSRVTRAQDLVCKIRNTLGSWNWSDQHAIDAFNKALPDLVRLRAVADALPSQSFKAQFARLVLEPIATYGQPAGAACAQGLAVCDWLEDTLQDCGDDPQAWDSVSTVGQTTKSAGTKERDSLLKLVLGMAIRNYEYVPNGPLSKAPKDIVEDLKRVGIHLDVATVRKYLTEAVDRIELPDLRG